MLKNTQKTKEIYEDIQRRLYYMIPEKWDELYLYASVIDKSKKEQTGELYFYYRPKGILKKKPISVYEIPAKFNLDEEQYLGLVDLLYDKIKELRKEHKKNEPQQQVWSNLTLTIKSSRFRIEFSYEDLEKSDYTSYEKHIIWRYNVLGISMEQCKREEREILKRYFAGVKTLARKEEFDSGIYIQNIKNIVDFATEDYENKHDIEYIKEDEKIKKTNKNQILMSEDDEEDDDSQEKYIFDDIEQKRTFINFI